MGCARSLCSQRWRRSGLSANGQTSRSRARECSNNASHLLPCLVVSRRNPPLIVRFSAADARLRRSCIRDLEVTLSEVLVDIIAKERS